MLSTTIRVAIADDHRAVRQAIINALSQYRDLCFVYDAETGMDLLTFLSKKDADVVLLDIKMPEMNGIETLGIIREKYPAVRILILSAYCDEVYVAKCLDYGINGYLTKTMDIQDIFRAIKTAYANEVYVTNLLNHSYLKTYALKYKKNATHFLPDFTAEEIRILELLKSETTTDEISNIVCLSKRSIEIKRDKMKEKANVRTIGGLLIYAIKRGLIE